MVVGAGVGVRLISEGPFRSGVVKFNSIVASRKGNIELGGGFDWFRPSLFLICNIYIIGGIYHKWKQWTIP